ncbi:Rv0361 family membrane protein [Mycolicibacterium fortuitum]|uniref:Rv0361 family membrane protein n=1 Tax=Mycolicibacterium fortuitum TaxID=1766 RepID=UPI00262CE2F8|nr:hypothetical protein [Mycolicibacterium fortuitum]
MTFPPPGQQGQWPPQQPYGNQPPPPQPYGAQPQYGGAQPPYYGESAPFGGGAPSQPPGNGKSPWLLIGGIGVAVAVLIGAAVFAFGGSDSDSDSATGGGSGAGFGAGGSSEQRAIEKLLEDMGKTDGTMAGIKKYTCAADQELLKGVDESLLGTMKADVPKTGANGTAKITDWQIAGDTASAQITVSGQPGGTLYFRKESGEWKVCSSDNPNMPAMPSMP